MVGCCSGRWSVIVLVGGRCFSQPLVGGRWSTVVLVGGRFFHNHWSVVGGRRSVVGGF